MEPRHLPPRFPRPARRAFLAGLVVLAVAGAPAGCARRSGGHAVGAADTLANGLPRPLATQLAGWLQAWGAAAPGFAPESLLRVTREPYRFESPRPGNGAKWVETLRTRALIEVLSPDSARSVDFDRYLVVDGETDGAPDFGREPDSAPVLRDFAADTIWTVDFCGTPCFYDGACWVDATRFALTGATRSGEQADGPWQAFLDVHDLFTHERSRWLSRPVDDEAFDRYQRAYGALLRARLREAARGRQASPNTGSGPIAAR